MRISHAHAPGEDMARLSVNLRRGPWKFSASAVAKRPTNLSVRGDLIQAARAARLNLSALLERALEEELVRVKWRQWREENTTCIAAYNRHVKAHGAFAQIWLRP
jgi:antitoxin CcdA